MKDGPLQFTLRRLQALLFSPRYWAVMFAVAVVLGLTGPFGTFGQMPLLPRFAYWLTLSLATFMIGYAAIGLMLHFLPGAAWPRPVRIALAGLVAGAPVTAVVVVLNHLLFADAIGPAADLLGLYVNCSLIAAAISFLFGLVDRGGTGEGRPAMPVAGQPGPADGGPSDPAGATPAEASPPLLERLPHRVRGRLLYLSMQDHYVDVHTDRGAALVLMRFGDAIRETGRIAGLQIHRSHWVAIDAVEGTTRRDGKLFLKMADGALLPVSRGALGSVKAAGLA